MADQTAAAATTTDSALSKYGSRKFLLAVAVVGLTTFMRFRGVLSEEATVSLFMTALVGYQGANVAAKLADNKKTTP